MDSTFNMQWQRARYTAVAAAAAAAGHACSGCFLLGALYVAAAPLAAMMLKSLASSDRSSYTNDPNTMEFGRPCLHDYSSSRKHILKTQKFH